MAQDITAIKQKIQKLLAQAEDRAGTPEGETFQKKAFELLARYGLADSDIDTGDNDPAEVLHITLDLAGKYSQNQQILLTAIAGGLRCRTVFHRDSISKREIAHIFGARRHVDRINLLWPLLANLMAAGALKQKASRDSLYTTAQLRRSFMSGFAYTVKQRLLAVDNEIAHEQGRGTEIMLLSDAKKAQNKLEEVFPRTRKTKSKARLSTTSFEAGCKEAEEADLAQQRLRGRAALTASPTAPSPPMGLFHARNRPRHCPPTAPRAARKHSRIKPMPALR